MQPACSSLQPMVVRFLGFMFCSQTLQQQQTGSDKKGEQVIAVLMQCAAMPAGNVLHLGVKECCLRFEF